MSLIDDLEIEEPFIALKNLSEETLSHLMCDFN